MYHYLTTVVTSVAGDQDPHGRRPQPELIWLHGARWRVLRTRSASAFRHLQRRRCGLSVDESGVPREGVGEPPRVHREQRCRKLIRGEEARL